MATGKCKLCHKTKELKVSHIIPNAIFRKVLRGSGGRAVSFNDDSETPVHYSTDSWSEELFCLACEEKLNKYYENYSISILRNSLKSVEITKLDIGVSFKNIDLKKFSSFFTSIIWRASVSRNDEIFSKVHLPEPYANDIRICLLENKKIKSSIIGVRVSKLIDKQKTNGFTKESIRNFIVSPFCRDLGRNFSFCFLAEGFFIEVFFPGLKVKNRTKLGILNQNKDIFIAPFLNIFDVPELLDVMVAGLRKDIEGNSKVK